MHVSHRGPYFSQPLTAERSHSYNPSTTARYDHIDARYGRATTIGMEARHKFLTYTEARRRLEEPHGCASSI